MSKFDPQFEKKRKEKQAAEEQAAEQAALKKEAPPAPAADANAADAKTVTPAEGSGKETQPAPDAKANTTATEPVTEPPAKDAAAPAKDAAVSADAPATKKDEAAPAPPATAAPGKSPAQPPPTASPAPAADPRNKPLTDAKQLTPEEEKKKEDKRQKRVRRKDELELRRAIKDPNYYKLSEFAGSKNPEAERKRMIVEMYVLFHERGKSLPGDEQAREIMRIDMAFKRFKGRGAESVDAFFIEMQREVKEDDEVEAFGFELIGQIVRSQLSSPSTPGQPPGISWLQFSEAAKKHPKYKPQLEGALFRLWEDTSDVRKDIDSVAKFSSGDQLKPFEVKEKIKQMLTFRRIYGPQAKEEGEKGIDALAGMATEGEVFKPLPMARKIFGTSDPSEKSPWQHRQKYRARRDEFAAKYNLTPGDVDDIIKHRLGAQEKPVSRDALGQIHVRPDVFDQGLPALQKAIQDSDLHPLEKRSMLEGLPERYKQFQKDFVENTIKEMPEFAKHFGIRSAEDFDKVLAALNKTEWEQMAGGAAAAADRSVSALDAGLGKIEGAVRFDDEVPFMTRRSEDVAKNARANEQINALSQRFYKEQTTLFGIDAAIIGQAVYGTAESVLLTTATAGLLPPVAVARYGSVAVAFNNVRKVAPAVTLLAAKQGFTTYDQAIRMGFKEEDATRLGWYSVMAEGVTTLAFNSIGAGGLESIVSGGSRKALQDALSASVKSTWQEGAKAMAKGMLAEVTEEQFITILDTALVQMEMNPNMTFEDLQRNLTETALLTLFTTAPFAAGHGKHVYDDTLANNRRIQEGQAGTFTSPPVTGEIAADASAGTPVDGTPVDGTPVDGTPVEGAPVDDAPVDGAPVDGAPVDGAPVDGAPAQKADEAAATTTPETVPAEISTVGQPNGSSSTVVEFPAIERAPLATYTPGSGFTLQDPNTGVEIGRAATAEEATRIAAERADLTLEDDAAAIANITAAYQRAENAGSQGDITASPVSKQAENTEAKTEGITSPKEQATKTVEAAPNTPPGNQTDTLTDATLDSLSEAISQDHPEINVRDGAQGLLDAPWARNATVMPELLPIAMEGAGSSFSNEQRISTFRDATDAQLLAVGVSPGDLASIRAALDGNPDDGIKAINEAFTRLDPNSAIAHEALQDVRADHQNRYETGQKPYRLTALPDGRFRVENEKGKVLALAPGYKALVSIRKYLSGEAGRHPRVPDYSAVPDPKNLHASDRPTPRQKREIRKINLAYNNQILRDDDTGEILTTPEQSRKDVTPLPTEMHLDHIIPRDKGGTRTSANLRVRSRANNLRKSNKLPNEPF